MNRLRKHWPAALVLLVFFGISTAYALVESKNMDYVNRSRDVRIGPIAIQAADGGVLTGTNGVITRALLMSGDAGVAAPAATVFATMPYCSRVKVFLYDEANDGTLTMTSVVIRGIDQFGEQRQETLTTINESLTPYGDAGARLALSDHVYCSINYAVGAGASGMANTDGGTDQMVVAVTGQVGTTVPINAYGDIQDICIVDSSDSSRVKCALAASSGGAIGINGMTTVNRGNVNTEALAFGALANTDGGQVAAATGDTILLRVRPYATARP